MDALILSFLSYTGLYQDQKETLVACHSKSNTQLMVSSQPLAPNSVAITSIDPNKFHLEDWSKKEIEESYLYLQGIVKKIEEQEKKPSYMVYAKDNLASSSPLHWDYIPYEKTTWKIIRFWQQFKILWRITFGGFTLPNQEQRRISTDYATFFQSYRDQEQGDPIEKPKHTDAFCQVEVINKQCVLQGEKINVLYSYTPIGFGGERLHFLFTPKMHAERFTDLSKEEYSEALYLAQKVIAILKTTRPNIQNVYLFHKTGEDAGQTVAHWHMHLVVTTNASQDFYGKLTVLKNMIIGSSPLKGTFLKNEVDKYALELKE